MKSLATIMFLVAVSALAQLTNPTVCAPSLPLSFAKSNWVINAGPSSITNLVLYEPAYVTNFTLRDVQVLDRFTNYIDSDVFAGDRKHRTNFVTTVFAVDIPGHGRATNQVTRTNCVTLKLKWVEEK